MMRAVYRWDRRRGASWRTGSFTCMGHWARDADLDHAWVGFAPPFRFAPFAAGAGTWDGKLGISVALHPALAACLPDADACAQRWMDEVDKLV